MSATGQQPPGNVISPAPEPAQVEVSRYQCPKPGCDTVSESKRGIRQHATRMHGDHWTKLTVACLNCGGTFYAKPDRRDTARYCSHDCREGPNATGDPDILSEPVGAVETRITRYQCPIGGCDRLFETERGTQRHITDTHPEHSGVKLSCERCGDVFQRKASAVSYARFCSEECRDRSRRRRVTLSCDFCGEAFWTHKCREEIARFCSKECHYFGVLAHPIAWLDPEDLGLSKLGEAQKLRTLTTISKEAMTLE